MACGLWPVVYGGTFLDSKLFTSHPMLGRVGYGLTKQGGKHHFSEGVYGPGMLYPTLYFLRGHPESRRELFSSVFYPQCLSVRVVVNFLLCHSDNTSNISNHGATTVGGGGR